MHLNWRRQFQTFPAFLVLLPSRQVNYKWILVVIDHKKMLCNEPVQMVQIMIDAPGLAKVFIDLVVRHHNLPDLIVSNKDSVSTSKS